MIIFVCLPLENTCSIQEGGNLFARVSPALSTIYLTCRKCEANIGWVVGSEWMNGKQYILGTTAWLELSTPSPLQGLVQGCFSGRLDTVRVESLLTKTILVTWRLVKKPQGAPFKECPRLFHKNNWRQGGTMSDSLKQLAFWTALLSGLLGEGATPAGHRLPPQACGLSSGWKAWGPNLTGGPWTCTLQVEGLSVLTLTVLGSRVFWWLTEETAALWSVSQHKNQLRAGKSWEHSAGVYKQQSKEWRKTQTLGWDDLLGVQEEPREDHWCWGRRGGGEHWVTVGLWILRGVSLGRSGLHPPPHNVGSVRFHPEPVTPVYSPPKASAAPGTHPHLSLCNPVPACLLAFLSSDSCPSSLHPSHTGLLFILFFPCSWNIPGFLPPLGAFVLQLSPSGMQFHPDRHKISSFSYNIRASGQGPSAQRPSLTSGCRVTHAAPQHATLLSVLLSALSAVVSLAYSLRVYFTSPPTWT